MITYLLIVILSLLSVSFLIISLLEYKYIKFVLNRHFVVLEGAEKTRDDLVELERTLIEFTNNPIIMMETDYKRSRSLLEKARIRMASFEEFYQSLPENRDKNDSEG